MDLLLMVYPAETPLLAFIFAPVSAKVNAAQDINPIYVRSSLLVDHSDDALQKVPLVEEWMNDRTVGLEEVRLDIGRVG